MKLKSLSLNYERELWQAKCDLVIGVDEVGRGALAGPVTAAAVAFSPAANEPPNGILINDSKKLTAKRREISNEYIRRNALAYEIASFSPSFIDERGITKAIESSVKTSLKKLTDLIFRNKSKLKMMVLIDGTRVTKINTDHPSDRIVYSAVKKGDGIVFSIAAASIVAKVHRDSIMRKLGRNYPEYGWERNKGYGTEEHRSAILEYGLCEHHRRSYLDSQV